MSPLDGVNVWTADPEMLAAYVEAPQSPQIANVDDLSGRTASHSEGFETRSHAGRAGATPAHIHLKRRKSYVFSLVQHWSARITSSREIMPTSC